MIEIPGGRRVSYAMTRRVLFLILLAACGSKESSNEVYPAPAPSPTPPPPKGPRLQLDGAVGMWGTPAPAGSGSGSGSGSGAPAIGPTLLVLDSDQPVEVKLRRGGDPVSVKVDSVQKILVHPDPEGRNTVEIIRGDETTTFTLGAPATVLYSFDAMRTYKVSLGRYGFAMNAGTWSVEYRGAVAYRLGEVQHVFEPLPGTAKLGTELTSIERVDGAAKPACEVVKELRVCRFDKRLRVSRRGALAGKPAAVLVDLAGSQERAIAVDGVEVAKVTAPTWVDVDEGVHVLAVSRAGRVVDQLKKRLEGNTTYLFDPQGAVAYQLETREYGDKYAMSPSLQKLRDMGYGPTPPAPKWIGGVRFLDIDRLHLFAPWPEKLSVAMFQQSADLERLVRAGGAGGLAPRTAQVKALLAAVAKKKPASLKLLEERIDPAWADECDVVMLADLLETPHGIREVVANMCPRLPPS